MSFLRCCCQLSLVSRHRLSRAGSPLPRRPVGPVGVVPETSRDRVGAMVVGEGVAGCLLRSKAVERQVQDRCPHLVSEPSAALIGRQPGEGGDRSESGEVHSGQCLLPDGSAVHHDHEVKPPAIRLDYAAVPPDRPEPRGDSQVRIGLVERPKPSPRWPPRWPRPGSPGSPTRAAAPGHSGHPHAGRAARAWRGARPGWAHSTRGDDPEHGHHDTNPCAVPGLPAEARSLFGRLVT
jgi:hypothetical protein